MLIVILLLSLVGNPFRISEASVTPPSLFDVSPVLLSLLLSWLGDPFLLSSLISKEFKLRLTLVLFACGADVF